jgi:hypothetical protein
MSLNFVEYGWIVGKDSFSWIYTIFRINPSRLNLGS